MRTLTLATDNFDQVNTFKINVGRCEKWVSLMLDYNKPGDGIYWALSSGAVLKSNYTKADTEERDRLNAQTAIQNGEIVLINGERYKTRVLGNCSDCAMFDKVEF